MIYIKKLKYETKEQGIADLISKEIYTEELEYCEGVHAVVEIGLVILTDGTHDEQGNEITEPIYADGYHYDVMSEHEIIFENEIKVKNPKHQFSGYETETI